MIGKRASKQQVTQFDLGIWSSADFQALQQIVKAWRD